MNFLFPIALFLMVISHSEAHYQSHQLIRGDANSDGLVNITDVLFSIQHLDHPECSAFCLLAADSNSDGNYGIPDIIYTLNYLFMGSSAPPCPFPECGEDNNHYGLSCHNPSLCNP